MEREDIPDPEDPATFERSRIHLGSARDAYQADMLRWSEGLMDLRTAIPSLGAGEEKSGRQVLTYERENVLVLHRWAEQGPEALLVLSFDSETTSVMLWKPVGRWSLRLDSSARDYGGNGQERIARELAIPWRALPCPSRGTRSRYFWRWRDQSVTMRSRAASRGVGSW